MFESRYCTLYSTPFPILCVYQDLLRATFICLIFHMSYLSYVFIVLSFICLIFHMAYLSYVLSFICMSCLSYVLSFSKILKVSPNEPSPISVRCSGFEPGITAFANFHEAALSPMQKSKSQADVLPLDSEWDSVNF